MPSTSTFDSLKPMGTSVATSTAYRSPHITPLISLRIMLLATWLLRLRFFLWRYMIPLVRLDLERYEALESQTDYEASAFINALQLSSSRSSLRHTQPPSYGESASMHPGKVVGRSDDVAEGAKPKRQMQSAYVDEERGLGDEDEEEEEEGFAVGQDEDDGGMDKARSWWDKMSKGPWIALHLAFCEEE